MTVLIIKQAVSLTSFSNLEFNFCWIGVQWKGCETISILPVVHSSMNDLSLKKQFNLVWTNELLANLTKVDPNLPVLHENVLEPSHRYPDWTRFYSFLLGKELFLKNVMLAWNKMKFKPSVFSLSPFSQHNSPD